ncbi:hypothetical protein GCM10010988_41120 [Cnuibacter physcomitrellae]|uniref:hypothetical protein n=1 Tax=Cnuibacter physcomitrellae TaxID=1619308 RepID=UPI00199A06F9|nr:hypothetical protein [Cnuibacter physcomitrellae]GGI42854.1 hypothetical protein GCM10010988_41120 [Cnuibacter physcomitrellae]
MGLPVDGELRPAVGEGHPWPAQIKPGALGRFGTSGRELVELTLVEPIMVEISTDVAWSGRSFRHAVRYLRARPGLDPADVAERER